MKRPGIDGNIIACYFLNLILNAFWLIPIAAIFILSAIFGWPAWAGWAALAAWAIIIFVATLVMAWAVSTGSASTTPTGLPGKTTIRHSSGRPNSLQEYADAHQRNTSDD